MGRKSKNMEKIIIHCTPEQYNKFYTLKKAFNQMRRIHHTNREFLEVLLFLAENELSKKKIKVESY